MLYSELRLHLKTLLVLLLVKYWKLESNVPSDLIVSFFSDQLDPDMN